MATTSFDKSFIVTNEERIEKFRRAAATPRKVVVKRRNYESDRSKGIQLLAQRLSSSVT